MDVGNIYDHGHLYCYSKTDRLSDSSFGCEEECSCHIRLGLQLRINGAHARLDNHAT